MRIGTGVTSATNWWPYEKTPWFVGPYQVYKRVSQTCYAVKDLPCNRRTRLWRRFNLRSSQIRLYHPRYESDWKPKSVSESKEHPNDEADVVSLPIYSEESLRIASRIPWISTMPALLLHVVHHVRPVVPSSTELSEIITHPPVPVLTRGVACPAPLFAKITTIIKLLFISYF